MKFSLNRPTGPIQSLSHDVRLCFCVFFKPLISPIYKCYRSNWSIAKRFVWEKFWKDIGLRFRNFGSEMVKNHNLKNCLFLSHRHSLLMDLGQDQQQHPTVHSGGFSRYPFRSPCAHLLFPFRSPFATLGNSETCWNGWKRINFEFPSFWVEFPSFWVSKWERKESGRGPC